MNKRMSYLGIVAIALAAVLGIARTGHTARKPAAEIKIVSDDIGGVVTSSKGPEAGVWVIAETKDLPTGYRKIVVTDDQGRYVIPELPESELRRLGARLRPGGFSQSESGARQNAGSDGGHRVRCAAKRRSIIPPPTGIPCCTFRRRAISPARATTETASPSASRSQAKWVERVKTDGCESCHQLGDKATREIPKGLGAFDSSFAAWDRRIQSGQVGSAMNTSADQSRKKAAPDGICGLDGSHQGWRIAARPAASAG